MFIKEEKAWEQEQRAGRSHSHPHTKEQSVNQMQSEAYRLSQQGV